MKSAYSILCLGVCSRESIHVYMKICGYITVNRGLSSIVEPPALEDFGSEPYQGSEFSRLE